MDSQFLDPNTVYSQAQNIIGGAQAGQAQYTPQVANYTNAANSAQGNLQQYQQSLQDPQNQLGNVYSKNLQDAQSMYGFDPMEMKKAQQALAQTNTVMSNLPQAIQQSANGRGITGAQEASRYQQAAGNVQGVLAGQGNAVNALQSTLGATQQQAQTQTGFTGQSQQLQLTSLNQVFQNAMSQQTQAQSQLQYFKTLEASGVQLNEQEQGQVAALRQAQAQAAMAAAQAQQAAAQMMNAETNKQYVQAQLSGLNGGATSNGNLMANGQAKFAPLTTSGNPGVLQNIQAYLQGQGDTFMQGPAGIVNGAKSMLGV